MHAVRFGKSVLCTACWNKTSLKHIHVRDCPGILVLWYISCSGLSRDPGSLVHPCSGMSRDPGSLVHPMFRIVQGSWFSGTSHVRDCPGILVLWYIPCSGLFRDPGSLVHPMFGIVQGSWFSGTSHVRDCPGILVLWYTPCSGLSRDPSSLVHPMFGIVQGSCFSGTSHVRDCPGILVLWYIPCTGLSRDPGSGTSNVRNCPWILVLWYIPCTGLSMTGTSVSNLARLPTACSKYTCSDRYPKFFITEHSAWREYELELLLLLCVIFHYFIFDCIKKCLLSC